jgi:hypothetical protein
MEMLGAISGMLGGLLDFFKPAEDTVVVYDIKKESGNKALWIVIGVLLFLVIGVILSIVLTR